MNNVIFVYSKNSRIRVLGLENAKDEHDSLLKDGFIHTQTIDPRPFIENLFNHCTNEEIIYEIKSLSSK